MDWLRILEIFMGGFLGGALGILSSYFWKWNGVKKLKRNIIIELIEIYNDLEDFKERVSYKTDIWEAAISSAILLDITRNLDYYTSIKKIYKIINEQADLENNTDFENCTEKAYQKVLSGRFKLKELIGENKFIKEKIK